MRRWSGRWVGRLALLGLAAAQAAADDGRRPGSAQMSPALQAMQRDDAQNPAQLWVQDGRSLMSRPAANGRRCLDCHAGRSLDDAAARHPAWDARLGRPATLAERINQCRVQHLQQASEGPDGEAVLSLSAWLAHQARGLAIAAPTDARLAPWVEQGRALWQRRLGQLNLSCAQCHDQRAGLRLGGATIPQGHPTAYPVYRLEWQTLGSLQRRLRGCLVGVRAEPWAADAPEWLALQAFLMQRSAGMALEGAGVRP